jgi:hypothetical protein
VFGFIGRICPYGHACVNSVYRRSVAKAKKEIDKMFKDLEK